MFVHNAKFLFITIAILATLGIGTPAMAQTCAAKTCSQAYSACTGKHCHRERSGGHHGDCSRFCSSELERCMRNGEFHGRVCQKSGLIRK
jgi:hypothetical protein